MGTVTIGQNVIQDGILELIEKIISNIHLKQVKTICKKQHCIEMVENIDFKNGDIVANNDQVAFKLDFEICFVLPTLIDRKGNFISVLPASPEDPSTPE